VYKRQGGWYGLYGPLGMPADLQQRVAAATAKALQDADLRKRWVEQGYVIWTGKGTDLADRMRREHTLWAEVTKGMSFE
jgi:tripartite-type tricarboxylate transporter receptor subunit TctC